MAYSYAFRYLSNFKTRTDSNGSSGTKKKKISDDDYDKQLKNYKRNCLTCNHVYIEKDSGTVSV